MKSYLTKVENHLKIINGEYNNLTDEIVNENNLNWDEIHDKLNSLKFIVGNIKRFEEELYLKQRIPDKILIDEKQTLKLRADNMRELYKITKYFLKLNGNKNYYKLSLIR